MTERNEGVGERKRKRREKKNEIYSFIYISLLISFGHLSICRCYLSVTLPTATASLTLPQGHTSPEERLVIKKFNNVDKIRY